MDQALVFASIILGVAVSDQVMSLHRLLRSPVKIRWHWAQPWFAAIVLMTDMMIWWAFAAPQPGPVSIGSFMPKIVALILLALLTLNSLPDDVREDGVDLAAYYQRNARYQWWLLGGIFAWMVASDAIDAVRHGDGLVRFVQSRLGDFVALALIVVMGLIHRWRGVAIGLALASIAPILWLARTIG